MADKNTLLYMDDDRAMLDMVGAFFKKRGYAVLLAEDGEKGLELFRSQQPDIVLVDLRMPRVDGFEVLDAISSESPDTPVIVISGKGEMADVIRVLRLGAWNYYEKPVKSLKIIQHTVEQALDKAKLIKENKQYRKVLENNLSAMILNFPGFIFTCTRDGRITYMNPALETYIGRDVKDKSCHELVFGRETPCGWCQEDILHSENIARHEIHSSRDGRWYHVIQLPVLDNNGQLRERHNILYDITERKQAFLDLQEREEYLRKENIRLRNSLSDRYKFGAIIGKSKLMQEVYDAIINAASTDAGVIIYGESGTGKELVARAIHENSDRKDKQLIYVNCGAIPENLIESEFFGYKKGAFTGASTDKHGFFDLADGGTLFLDEIGEIPLNMQVKLLRALEGNAYTPVGGTRVKMPDVRIIAATNSDLKELVKQGLMRQDFFYRIHIIPIRLPSLRKRREDISLLIDHFLKQYETEKVLHITPKVFKALQNYNWPGNVRELQNTIHRFVALKKLDFMGLESSEQPVDEMLEVTNIELLGKPLNVMLEELEKKILFKSFEQNNWQQTKTAKSLRIDRKTLYRKMKQFGIEKPSN